MSTAGTLCLPGVSGVCHGRQAGLLCARNLPVPKNAESSWAPEASVSIPGLKGEAHKHKPKILAMYSYSSF